MNSAKNSQKAIYEELNTEIQNLKKAQNQLQKVSDINQEHFKKLEKFYSRPIQVDIADMQDEHRSIRKTLKNGLCVHRQVASIFFVLILFVACSLTYNLHLYQVNKHKKNCIEQANNRILELRGKIEELNSKKEDDSSHS